MDCSKNPDNFPLHGKVAYDVDQTTHMSLNANTMTNLSVGQKLKILQKLFKWAEGSTNGVDAVRETCWDLSPEEWSKELGFTPNMDENADRVQDLFDSIGVGKYNDDDTLEDATTPVRDILSNNKPPNVVVSVNYTHPVLSHLKDGDFWCGASPDEEVYENPYNASRFSWEVDLQAWNSFQSKCKHMSPEEREQQWANRERDIEKEKSKFDSSYKGQKRARESD